MKLIRNLRSAIVLAAVLCLTVATLAADLTITATSVVPDSGYQYVDMSAGETITAGQVVYQSSSGVCKKADATTSSTTATIKGVALNGGATNQPIRVMTGGTYTVGATTAKGKVYVLSTAGLICPVDDLTTNDYVSVLGIATSTTKMKLAITNSGVQHP